MITGRSVSHVKQPIGKHYSKLTVEGYYNDLTRKVLRGKGSLLPSEKVETGEVLTLPTEVFQYGLGAYDLYLTSKKAKYLEIFKECSYWAINNLVDNGSWNNFYFIYPNNPYSSMTQGEGASLLFRAWCFSR